MQPVPRETLTETQQLEQSALLTLWEFDLTALGGGRHFFCAEVNERGEAVCWQGQAYMPYPISGQGFEMSGQGPSARPRVTVSNLFGLVTGMAEDLQGLIGVSVIRRQVYARFLDAANFEQGNPDANPEQEVVSRYVVEQIVLLTVREAVLALSSPVETDGAVCPGRLMLAEVCAWAYRSADCGYGGPPVADVFDQPTHDEARDACSRCRRGCALRGNEVNYGGFSAIDKLAR